MPQWKFENLVTVGTTGKTAVNTWWPLISKDIPGSIIAVDPALVKRLIVQLRGTVNGNLYLSPIAGITNRAGTDTTGLQLAVPAPAAGPTYPASFIDEVPCNHQGPIWFNADTTGLVFYVAVWV